MIMGIWGRGYLCRQSYQQLGGKFLVLLCRKMCPKKWHVFLFFLISFFFFTFLANYWECFENRSKNVWSGNLKFCSLGKISQHTTPLHELRKVQNWDILKNKSQWPLCCCFPQWSQTHNKKGRPRVPFSWNLSKLWIFLCWIRNFVG